MPIDLTRRFQLCWRQNLIKAIAESWSLLGYNSGVLVSLRSRNTGWNPPPQQFWGEMANGDLPPPSEKGGNEPDFVSRDI